MGEDQQYLFIDFEFTMPERGEGPTDFIQKS